MYTCMKFFYFLLFIFRLYLVPRLVLITCNHLYVFCSSCSALNSKVIRLATLSTSFCVPHLKNEMHEEKEQYFCVSFTISAEHVYFCKSGSLPYLGLLKFYRRTFHRFTYFTVCCSVDLLCWFFSVYTQN